MPAHILAHMLAMETPAPAPLSKSRRMLLLLCGHVSVVLGLIGLLLPLIPTSPFMIVAAACYARSSERFYRALIRNRYFGPPILRWREERCVPKRIKIYAILMLVVTFSISGLVFAQTATERAVVAAIALIPITVVALLPVCRDCRDKQSDS